MNTFFRVACYSSLLGLGAAAVVHADDHARVTLVYDEQKISDPDRAALYDAILAATPLSQWRSVKISTPQKVVTVLHDYYDYWYNPRSNDSTQSYLKVTTQMLDDRIRKANPGKVDSDGGVASGTTLLIPPLPVRGQTAAAPKGAGRLFDVETLSYKKVSSLSGELAQFIEKRPASQRRFTALLPYHIATTTGIQVDRNLLTEALRDPALRDRLPVGAVLMKSSSEAIQLRLPGAASPAPTQAPVVASPHTPDAEATWARDRQRGKDLVKKGGIQPPWI